MTKNKRSIIQIDEEKCDGCGLCIPACPEGALAIIDGKARLVREDFCDGLGACLGDCPQDALHVVEEEVEDYDAEGVLSHLREHAPEQVERHQQHLAEHGLDSTPAPAAACGCPSAQTMQWDRKPDEAAPAAPAALMASELRQWPVQLHLVSPLAPYFQDADLVLVADCVPFVSATFHQDWLRDKAVAVCCPKLDDPTGYLEKLRDIILQGRPRSVTVLFMEVPCCGGLVQLVQQALQQAQQAAPEGGTLGEIPFKVIRFSIRGEDPEEVTVG